MCIMHNMCAIIDMYAVSLNYTLIGKSLSQHYRNDTLLFMTIQNDLVTHLHHSHNVMILGNESDYNTLQHAF